MAEKIKNVKLEKTEKFITPVAGMSIFHNAIKSSYFYDNLNNTFNYMQKRKRGYSPSDKILAHMELILSGGENLSDIKMLDNDEGYKKITNKNSLPKANTLDTFYNSIRKKDYKKYEQFNSNEAIKYYVNNKIDKVTIDVDSSLSYTEKKTAKYSYEKEKGFNPMYLVDEKNKIILRSKFRNGNASPQTDILELLQETIKKFKEVIPCMKIKVRIDSAGFQLKIVKYLTKKFYGFAIRGDVNKSKINEFDLIYDKLWENINKNTDICRTTTTINSGSMGFIEVDAIVKRKKIQSKDDGYLEDIYSYSYIITNIGKEEMTNLEILNFYNKRGNAENIFKELKNDFALNSFPASSLYADAFYLQVVVSTYNIFQISKSKMFKKEWKKHRLKTIRYLIINTAGYVVRTGRQIILKVFKNYKYYNEFQSALEISYSALL